MRWEIIVNTTRKKVYELWHKDKYVLSLTYNPTIGTARIESSEEKRLFVISKEGLFRKKTVLRNEYGFRIGKLGQENHTNYIEMEGERFFYNLRKYPENELVIFKDTEEKPLIVCSISPVKTQVENMLTEISNPVEPSNNASLVMTLCWLLFQPFIKAKQFEFFL